MSNESDVLVPTQQIPTPTRRDVWARMLLYPGDTLPAAIAPVLVGTGLAVRAGVFAAGPALAALLGGWLVQLGGVFADNYNNLSRHPDDAEHAAFVAALRRGVITLRTLQLAIAACYLGALLAGGWLVWIGGPPVALILFASIAASLAYSTDPFALGERALGDPLFFVFFGPVSVIGSYYVQLAAHAPAFPVLPAPEAVTSAGVACGIAMGALITNILVIDNIRDRVYDAAKGETTVAVLIGERWSRAEYAALTILAYAVPFWLYFMTPLGKPVLLPILSVPYAVTVAGRLVRARGRGELVPLTPQAGQLVLLYAILLFTGIVW